jgi:hypothetical protein
MDRVTVTSWRKASYSSGNGGACIEVGQADRTVAVRDTQDRQGPMLAFRPDAWRKFTRTLKSAK